MTTARQPGRIRKPNKTEIRKINAQMDHLPGLLKSPEQWGEEFRASWGRNIEAIIAHGRLLQEGKYALGHGLWTHALRHAGIAEREAQKYMRIANKLAIPANLSVLPTAIATLDFLAGLQSETITELIESNVVTPTVTTRELKAAVTAPTERRWSQLEQWIVEKVADFFGGIDTLAVDNEYLSAEWTGRTFVNPPHIGESHITRDWITKSLAEWRIGRVSEAVLWLPVVSYTNWFGSLLNEFPACFSLGKPGGTPVVIFYLGDRRYEFCVTFADIGTTVVPARGALAISEPSSGQDPGVADHTHQRKERAT
jgi:hypothetical protein